MPVSERISNSPDSHFTTMQEETETGFLPTPLCLEWSSDARRYTTDHLKAFSLIWALALTLSRVCLGV